MLAAQPARRVGARARRRSSAATTSSTLLDSLYERVARERRPHLVTVIGPGRRRQVAPAATSCERRLAERAAAADLPRGPLPALRLGNRLLGAGRGDPRRGRASSTATAPRRPGRSCSATVDGLMAFSTAEQAEPRRAARGRDRAPARHRRAARGRTARDRRPAAHARGFFSAVRSVIEAHGAPEAAGARVRGHPLGRPRNARPDRVPRAVGARAAGAAVPGARRAARAPRRLGRRPPRGDVDPARPADRRARRASWSRAAARRRRRRAPTRSRRRRARRRQPVLRRGDGAPAGRGASGEAVRAARHRAGLLAARLDSLEPLERRLVQHAAVVGRTFWEGRSRHRRADDARHLARR